MHNPNLAKLFLRAMKRDPFSKETLEIVANNSSGNVWFVGGYVFRTLARELYGSAEPAPDIDIIVARYHGPPRLPRGWKSVTNRYGNPKFKREGCKIDLIPIRNITRIKQKGLAPTIRNYLAGTPLTIQSLAFDVRNNRVVGAEGVRALKARTVGVHNRDEAQAWAETYNTTVRERITSKANAIGFTPLYD